jgi:hypothetical protein
MTLGGVEETECTDDAKVDVDGNEPDDIPVKKIELDVDCEDAANNEEEVAVVGNGGGGGRQGDRSVVTDS